MKWVSILIVVFSMTTLMFTTISIPQLQHANACKLKSEITLEDMGLFGMNNLTINEKGEVVGWKQDFSHATVPCETVGDALNSGYTMDEIRQDQLRQTPLS